MSVIPDKALEVYEFSAARVGVWSVLATQIGLTASEVSALEDANDGFSTSNDNAVKARAASKAATEALRTSTRTMRTRLSDAVQKIRLFAEATNNPNVYALAQIPAPAARTPAPPPAQPTDLNATISPTGQLTLSFRAVNSGSGTSFLIRRKLATESNFSFIGTATSTRSVVKTFIDDTLPAGSTNMQYIIYGQRGSVRGADSPIFTVVIGGSAGERSVSVVKLAA
ncbi:MAG: hypothetical protein ACK5WB_03680 [Phycisphaerales bacterium]|jgi:hypothetical protein|nr:hypothetical protein [Phycisphaeraceae bacterium]